MEKVDYARWVEIRTGDGKVVILRTKVAWLILNFREGNINSSR